MINTNYYRNYNTIASRMNLANFQRYGVRNNINNLNSSNLYNNLISQQNNIYSNNLRKYYEYEEESSSFNSNFKQKFQALKTSAERLQEYSSTSVFNSKQLESSNADVLKVTNAPKYSELNTEIDVNQIAKAQKTETNSFSENGYDLSHLGGMTLKTNSKTYDINLNLLGKNNEEAMNEIASNINKANSGITARVSRSLGKSSLEFISNETGESHKFQLSFNGDLQDKVKLTNSVEAQNAKYTIDNKSYVSESNNIKIANNSIEATLKGAGTSKIQKGYADDSKVTSAVKDFIKNYNNAESFLNDNSSKSNQIKNLAYDYSSVKYSSNSLSSIGINVDRDGKLTLDEKKFTSELKNNRNNVKRILGNSSTGLASRTYNKTSSAINNYRDLYPKMKLQNTNAVNNTYFYNSANSSIIQANAAYSSGLLVNYLL